MLVEEAIELLKKHQKPGDEIVFAYWELAAFTDCGWEISDELWSDVCAADHQINWCTAHESIGYFIEELMEEDDAEQIHTHI